MPEVIGATEEIYYIQCWRNGGVQHVPVIVRQQDLAKMNGSVLVYPHEGNTIIDPNGSEVMSNLLFYDSEGGNPVSDDHPLPPATGVLPSTTSLGEYRYQNRNPNRPCNCGRCGVCILKEVD